MVVGEGQLQGRSHDVLNVAHALFLVVQTTITNTIRSQVPRKARKGVGLTWACLRAVSMERGEISSPIMRWPCLAIASVASPPAHHMVLFNTTRLRCE